MRLRGFIQAVREAEDEITMSITRRRVVIWENPTPNEVIGAAGRAQHRHLRGISVGQEWVLWDGAEPMVHNDMYRELVAQSVFDPEQPRFDYNIHWEPKGSTFDVYSWASGFLFPGPEQDRVPNQHFQRFRARLAKSKRAMVEAEDEFPTAGWFDPNTGSVLAVGHNDEHDSIAGQHLGGSDRALSQGWVRYGIMQYRSYWQAVRPSAMRRAIVEIERRLNFRVQFSVDEFLIELRGIDMILHGSELDEFLKGRMRFPDQPERRRSWGLTESAQEHDGITVWTNPGPQEMCGLVRRHGDLRGSAYTGTGLQPRFWVFAAASALHGEIRSEMTPDRVPDDFYLADFAIADRNNVGDWWEPAVRAVFPLDPDTVLVTNRDYVDALRGQPGLQRLLHPK